MNHDKKFRACFITALLLISTLTVLIITPTSTKAILLEEDTTLYFHGSFIEGVTLDENMSENSSYKAWPPKIKDVESLATWFTLWTIYSLFDNESDPDYEDLIEEIEIYYGSPLSVSSIYYNTFPETVEINGDVTFDLYLSLIHI